MLKWPVFALAIALVLPGTVYAGAAATYKFDDKIDSMRKAGVGPVIFPHAAHEKINKCEDCHPKIFKDKKGANQGMSMKANMEGKFCGSAECHNGLNAFPLFECVKCHSQGAGK